MKPLSLLLILLVVTAVFGCKRTETTTAPTTVAATTQMTELLETRILAHVHVGMTSAQVENIISDLRPDLDWDDSSTLGPTAAYSNYPLGDGVHLILTYSNLSDPNGNIQSKDKVSAVEIVHFDDLKNQIPDGLFPYVRLIHLSPSVGGHEFDPVALIRAVNGLQVLGQKKALQALREYVKLATSDANSDANRAWRYDMDKQRVFLIARTLFVRKDGDPQMPWMIIGATEPDISLHEKDWPLFPLVVQNDIPFDLSGGYSLNGLAEPPTQHLDYCEAHCRLRDGLLRSNTSPLLAVETIFGSERWRVMYLKVEADNDPNYFGYGDEPKTLLRIQALRSVQSMLRTTPDYQKLNPQCVSQEETDRTWQGYLKDKRLREAKWDANTQSFR